MIRYPWKRGPEAEAINGPVVVSATRFVYRRYLYWPAVIYYAVRLYLGWGRRPGSVGLLVGAELVKRTTYSISVWRSEEALRQFLRAPDHVPLMRRFGSRLEDSASVMWQTDSFDVGEAWGEALQRLAERDLSAPPAGRSRPAPRTLSH